MGKEAFIDEEKKITSEIDACWKAYHEQRNEEALAKAEIEEVIPDLEVYEEELSVAIDFGQNMAKIHKYNVPAAVKDALVRIGFDETKVSTFYLVSLITNIFYARDYLEKKEVFNVPVELLDYYCSFSLDDKDCSIYNIIAPDLFEKNKDIIKSINAAKESANLDTMSISEIVFSVIKDLYENPEQVIAKKRKK